jgi:hypothetical protein
MIAGGIAHSTQDQSSMYRIQPVHHLRNFGKKRIIHNSGNRIVSPAFRLAAKQVGHANVETGSNSFQRHECWQDASHLDFRNVRARHIHPVRQDALRQAKLLSDFTDSHAQILDGI